MYNKVSLLVGKAGSRVTIIVTKAKSLFPDNGAGFCPCHQKRNPEQSFHFPLIYSSSGNSKESYHITTGAGDAQGTEKSRAGAARPAARACPVPPPTQQGSRGTRAAPAPAIRGMGIGQYRARMCEHGQAWLWGTPGLAWQSCGELDTGPAAALLGCCANSPGAAPGQSEGAPGAQTRPW